jgi:hypothetical protein
VACAGDRQGCAGPDGRTQAEARRRAQWVKYQNRIDPERLVFIDETWTKTNIAPLRGWAPRGLMLKANVPHGHWKTSTFLAGADKPALRSPVAQADTA